jgi:ribosomal-protein-alanine N-acetyltransferase
MSLERSMRLRTEHLVLRPTLPSDVVRAIEIRSDAAVARNLASATIPPDAQKMADWFASHAQE